MLKFDCMLYSLGLSTWRYISEEDTIWHIVQRVTKPFPAFRCCSGDVITVVGKNTIISYNTFTSRIEYSNDSPLIGKIYDAVSSYVDNGSYLLDVKFLSGTLDSLLKNLSVESKEELQTMKPNPLLPDADSYAVIPSGGMKLIACFKDNDISELFLYNTGLGWLTPMYNSIYKNALVDKIKKVYPEYFTDRESYETLYNFIKVWAPDKLNILEELKRQNPNVTLLDLSKKLI